jgi:hypothetical protein
MIIEETLAKELKKPFASRDKVLLNFLYKEKSVYEFAHAQLAWSLEEDEAAST